MDKSKSKSAKPSVKRTKTTRSQITDLDWDPSTSKIAKGGETSANSERDCELKPSLMAENKDLNESVIQPQLQKVQNASSNMQVQPEVQNVETQERKVLIIAGSSRIEEEEIKQSQLRLADRKSQPKSAKSNIYPHLQIHENGAVQIQDSLPRVGRSVRQSESQRSEMDCQLNDESFLQTYNELKKYLERMRESNVQPLLSKTEYFQSKIAEKAFVQIQTRLENVQQMCQNKQRTDNQNQEILMKMNIQTEETNSESRIIEESLIQPPKSSENVRPEGGEMNNPNSTVQFSQLQEILMLSKHDREKLKFEARITRQSIENALQNIKKYSQTLRNLNIQPQQQQTETEYIHLPQEILTQLNNQSESYRISGESLVLPHHIPNSMHLEQNIVRELIEPPKPNDGIIPLEMSNQWFSENQGSAQQTWMQPELQQAGNRVQRTIGNTFIQTQQSMEKVLPRMAELDIYTTQCRAENLQNLPEPLMALQSQNEDHFNQRIIEESFMQPQSILESNPSRMWESVTHTTPQRTENLDLPNTSEVFTQSTFQNEENNSELGIALLNLYQNTSECAQPIITQSIAYPYQSTENQEVTEMHMEINNSETENLNESHIHPRCPERESPRISAHYMYSLAIDNRGQQGSFTQNYIQTPEHISESRIAGESFTEPQFALENNPLIRMGESNEYLPFQMDTRSPYKKS